MSERNERLKPPSRRPGGRALGGGTKKTTPPPPPPTAELTPEQYAAEQTTAQGDSHHPAGEAQVQLAPSTDPVEGAARGRTETVPDGPPASVQPTIEASPSSLVPEPAVSQPAHPAVDAPEARTESAGLPAERQVLPGVPAAEPAIQPTQPAEHASINGPSHVASGAAGAAPAAEVAIRLAAPPVAGGTAFPVRTEGSGAHLEQHARSQEVRSEGAPYAHGPGRPKDIPEVAVVLNQRIIARESLDSSVPAALKIKKRIKRFALDNELDHLPIGDIVSVALDAWLTARGF
ncbi:hypothetical protein SAMN05216489_08345 [Streptomyces sp. 3213]|uniref:hypothetical protein n=1 Tax=Streptomyces sp. 3213.3 TaxID=1855348 RepID=UPI00089D7BA7|nr:hypothetical protein [Streptomyces sp. 3213.3]SEE79951.1 hypothetical protein SAMN05216489_08345 [Streptomyces sp. 3213] [Streptomyces sp. 3213.3]